MPGDSSTLTSSWSGNMPLQDASNSASGMADSSGRRGFRAALLSSAFLYIAIAAVVTVVLYVLPTWEKYRLRDNYIAVGAGVGAAIVVGILYALVMRGHTAPDHINPRQYGELCERWSGLDARLRLLCPPPEGAAESRRVACEEAVAHRDYIAGELAIQQAGNGSAGSLPKSTGGRWVLGTGFLDLWGRLHDAEAALFALQGREQVCANALLDELRLMDSGMKHETALLARLRGAATILGGKEYLASATAAEDNGFAESTAAADGAPETEARLVLADIRRTINQVRDDSRAGLLRTRNQLMWTGLITGLVTYTLLGLAILIDSPPESIAAAAVFFLVGAVVGLFSQLRGSSSGTDTSGEDDFGLARARLTFVPILSGLAGIGGVLVMTLLYPGLNVPLDVSQTVDKLPDLETVFDLDKNPFGLVLAAVFGLTPDLLINRLQGEADKYKADLESTSVQTRSDPA